MADKWDWKVELTKAHLIQAEVGAHLGLSASQMAHLVTKMIPGQGLTATELDKARWKRALDYIAKEQGKEPTK